jgi:hypothetical protein
MIHGNAELQRLLDHSGMASAGVDLSMIRNLGDGTWIAIKPLLFHWTLLRGSLCDTVGYFDRWCYETQAGAEAALVAFPERPDRSYEPAGLHRHPASGRRRPGADPALEHFDP